MWTQDFLKPKARRHQTHSTLPFLFPCRDFHGPCVTTWMKPCTRSSNAHPRKKSTRAERLISSSRKPWQCRVSATGSASRDEFRFTLLQKLHLNSCATVESLKSQCPLEVSHCVIGTLGSSRSFVCLSVYTRHRLETWVQTRILGKTSPQQGLFVRPLGPPWFGREIAQHEICHRVPISPMKYLCRASAAQEL